MLLSPFVKRCGLSIWINLNPLNQRMVFAKCDWNWPSGSIEEEFSLFRHYLLWITTGLFIWTNFNLQWLWRRRFFKFFNTLTQFRNYLPLEKGHIWTNLIPFYPRMLCTQFDWNQMSGSGKEDFQCPPIFSLTPFFVCKSTHAVNYHSWWNHYDHNSIKNGIYM